MKSRLMILVSMLTLIASLGGCVSNRTFEFSKSYAVPVDKNLPGPPVVLFPVDETSPQADAFSRNPNYMGDGMGMILLIVVIPIAEASIEFYSDLSRVDVIRAAEVHELASAGIPSVPLARQDMGGFSSQPPGTLGLEIRLKKLEANTNLDFFFTLLIDTVISYNDVTTRVTIDCTLHEAGNNMPLWSGTVDEHYNDDVPVADAISRTVSQCVSRSGLADKWKTFSTQQYAALMIKASDEAAAGNNQAAMDDFGKASLMALSADSGEDAFGKMAKQFQLLGGQVAVPESARKYYVMGDAAVRSKKFAEAADLYRQGNTVAPWWPAGHYNRGLILAEVNRNNDAADELKKYLALVPGSANAREVQDRIYVLQSSHQ